MERGNIGEGEREFREANNSSGTGLSFDLECAPPKEYHPRLHVISKHHQAAPCHHRADAGTRRCGRSSVRLHGRHAGGGRQVDRDHRDASIDHQSMVNTDNEIAIDVPQIDSPAAQTLSPQMQGDFLHPPIDHAAASTSQPSRSAHTNHPLPFLGGENCVATTDHTLLLEAWNEFFIQKDPGGAVTRDAPPRDVKRRGLRRFVKKRSQVRVLSFDKEYAPPKEYHPGLPVNINGHHGSTPCHREAGGAHKHGQSGEGPRGRRGRGGRDAGIPQVKAPVVQPLSPQMQDVSEDSELLVTLPSEQSSSLLQSWSKFLIQEDPGKRLSFDTGSSKVLFDVLRKDTNQLLEASPKVLREYLIHLREHMVNVVTPCTKTQNIHAMVEFLLIILTYMSKNIFHHDIFSNLLARVGAFTREVSVLVCELEEKTDRKSLDLLDTIELLKGDLKRIFSKAPVDSFEMSFPMSDGPLFMHLLLINLNDLLNSNDYTIAFIKEAIRLVKEDLEFIRFFFGNVEQALNKDLWARVLDVAYEAEYSINSMLVKSDHCRLQHYLLLSKTIEKIKLIKEEVFNLPKKIPVDMGFNVVIPRNWGINVVSSRNKPVLKKSTSIAGQVIVGFKEETDLIIRKLTSGPPELDVISIIGMPGIGKTTLAYKIYNDKLVASHFDIRAWCTVDQECNEKKLLQSILNQVTGSNVRHDDHSDVADELRKRLYGRRYLIVLDDLWYTATWDELTRSFPEVKKGSRIILTSRKKEVILHGKRHSDPLYLRLFRVEESWELLEKRIFGEESCPDKLLDVGKRIAKNCRGLPLTADLIAGVLARKEKNKTSWLEVLNNLNSFGLKDEAYVMKVIQLSYVHLPDCLKPCLLYLASYPKDREIQVKGLKEFWTAEGLVEKREPKSMEEVLGVYLDGLISSSLVMGFHRLGVMETCKIHDLVHDFCLVKAEEEKLFGFISSKTPSSSNLLMPRRIIIPSCQHLRNSDDPYNLFNSEKKMVSSELLSVKIDTESWQINQLSHLRLIKVLCLGKIALRDSLLNEIGHLVHLRHLEIKTDAEALPLSWSSLSKLETLVVFNMGSIMRLLPRIWSLLKLRRLSMSSCVFFDSSNDELILLEKDSKLENLRILNRVELHYSKDTEDVYKRFPHLQSFKFRIRKSPANRNWFPKLDVLSELEELHATSYPARSRRRASDYSEANILCDVQFPWSLKTLRLRSFGLPSDSLSTISRLPNLQQLILDNTIIQGEEWNVGEDDTFVNLKYLELISVPLSEWQVGDESFPVLEELSLRLCKELKDIPSSFGDIASLQSIRVEWSCQELGDSAQKIKEYVADITGDDKLQVHVIH